MNHFDAAWALSTAWWMGVGYCWYRYGKATGRSEVRTEQVAAIRAEYQAALREYVESASQPDSEFFRQLEDGSA